MKKTLTPFLNQVKGSLYGLIEGEIKNVTLYKEGS